MNKWKLTGCSSAVLLLFASWTSAYELNGLKWSEPYTDMNVDFSLGGADRSSSGILWDDAFSQAADLWNTTTNFELTVHKNSPSDPCDSGDLRNGSAFVDDECGEPFGANVLAVTYSYYYTSKPDEVVEADILFNGAENWDIYEGSLKADADFKRVAAHELGHVMGLDHEEVEVALMAPNMSEIEVPQPDDLEGIAFLYGELNPGLAPIVMKIEEPFNGSIQSGVGTFRGWIVSQHGLSSLELFLDGKSKGQLQHDGVRKDVCNSYSEYPDCAESGFAFAFAWGLLSNGSHTYRLDARDVRGNILSKSVSFNVEHYDDAFVGDSSLVTLDAAVVTKQDEDIIIENLQHNGKEYRVRMRWRKASQDFEPIEITRTR